MSRLLPLTLAASLCLVAAAAQLQPEAQQEADALREQIFTLTDTILTPYRLGEQLRRLDELYRAGAAPDQQWASRVARLVEAANYADPAKCNGPAGLEEIQSLLEECAHLSVAIFQYLHHCRSELFSRCNAGASLRLDKATRQLDPAHLDSLQQLLAKVKAAGTSDTHLYLRVPKEQMVAGVSALLAPPGAAQKRISQHQDDYQRLVAQPCRQFRDKTDHLLAFYGRMLFKQDLLRQVKPDTLQFLELDKVCQLALSDYRSLQARSYKF